MTGRSAWLLALIVPVCACQGKSGATAPTPPLQAPTNSAPTVTLRAAGPASCAPTRFGCTVTLVADAADPDDDPLTYLWSGTSSGFRGDFSGDGWCRGGQAPQRNTAVCDIRSPEQVVLGSVTVSDDHGHAVAASLQIIGEGVNHPPSVRLTPPFSLPGGSVTLEMFGFIEDPDGANLCTADHVVSGSASGDCRPYVAFWSSCLEGGVTLDVDRTAMSGTCDVTLKVRDTAGLIGTTVTTIRY